MVLFQEALAPFSEVFQLELRLFSRHVLFDNQSVDSQRERYGVSLAGEVYEEPLHRQPVFEKYARRPLPVSEDLCARHICLPIYSGMMEDEAHYVLSAVKEALG